jgi:hypothetical protein
MMEPEWGHAPDTRQLTLEIDMNLPMNFLAEVLLTVSVMSTHAMQVSEWGEVC